MSRSEPELTSPGEEKEVGGTWENRDHNERDPEAKQEEKVHE